MSRLTFNEGAAPGTPSSGKVSVYAKTDGKVYAKDDVGTEYDLTQGAGGTPPFTDTNSIVQGSADATKQLRFEVDGNSTTIVGVVATTFSTAKTLTLPDATDTLVGQNTSDEFQNKTIDGASNTIKFEAAALGAAPSHVTIKVTGTTPHIAYISLQGSTQWDWYPLAAAI